MILLFIKRITFLLMFAALFPLKALADSDPWYTTQPSCVTDRGNPERTGEYKEAEIKQFHKSLWKTPLQEDINNSKILCYQNKIFAGIKAFDINTGKLAWQAPSLASNEKYDTSSMVIYKNHLYVRINKILEDKAKYKHIHYQYKGIADIDLSSNKLSYLPISIKLKGYSGVEILAFNDVLYISYTNGDDNGHNTGTGNKIIAYSLKQYKVLWEISQKLNSLTHFATDGDNLYFTNNKGIASVDLGTGKIRWLFKNKSVGNEIAYKNGVIYTDGAGGVWAIDANTGKLIWHFDGDMGNNFSPIYLTISDSKIYFSDASASIKNLYALDRFNGKLIWKIAKYIATNLFLTKDKLKVIDMTNYFQLNTKNNSIALRAFDSQTGKELSNIKLNFNTTLLIPYTENSFITKIAGIDSNSNKFIINLINVAS